MSRTLSGLENQRWKIQRELGFHGGPICGQIVEVLLPSRKYQGEQGYQYLNTVIRDIKITAQTVCLQAGQNNSVHVALVDFTMPDRISHCLSKVSDDGRLAVRVLRRDGASEEVVLTENDRAIDIRADFVRIIPPLDEESNVSVDSEIHTRHALIGNNHNITITPGGFREIFDCSRPVLRVLRSPTTSAAVCTYGRDFPRFDRDHLVVLEMCENRCTAQALKCGPAVFSSSAGSRNVRDHYGVKVTVRECGKNGETEIKNGVLLKREASFDRLKGVVGYWFRFQRSKGRHIVTFSLWRKGADQIVEVLDEVQIIVETNEDKRRQSSSRKTAKQRHFAEQISDETSPQEQLSRKQNSLPEQSRMTAEQNRENWLSVGKRKKRLLPTPIYEETVLPCQSQLAVSGSAVESEKTLPAEVVVFLEQSFHIMEILHPLRENGKWEEFDRGAEVLLDTYAKDSELKIAVILEQGMAACFRNELESAENFIKKAMTMFRQVSQNLLPLLKGRASYYLAGVYRRNKLTFGRAQRCIESAKKHLKNTDFTFDQACLSYEIGSLLLEQAHIFCMVEQAKQCFERCVEKCSLELTANTNNLLLTKHDMALMKKAMLLLNCSTRSGRESPSVVEDTLLEARQCLNCLKMQNVTEMPLIAQVQYHLVRSDQYFREQRLVDACAHAQIAFDLSHRYHFDTRVAAGERLDYVDRLRNSS